eukprot:5983753-Amphidinium_carterae.1
MHSCKATTLSWCAKAGLALEVRNLLGYHSVKQHGSALTYSRDALAEPLRQLRTQGGTSTTLGMVVCCLTLPEAGTCGHILAEPASPHAPTEIADEQ